MALPTSGPLSLSDIQTEFGGSNPISLNEYYAGGAYVPSGTTGTYGAVPTSGAISIQNFYGTSNVLDTQTISVGGYFDKYNSLVGYLAGYMGAISDGTFNPTGGSSIIGIYFDVSTSILWFILQGSPIANSGWTTMTISGSAFTRASGSFTSSGGQTYWYWSGASNPFPGISGDVNAVFT